MKNLTKTDWGELGSDPEKNHAFDLFFGKSKKDIFDLILRSPFTVSDCLFYIDDKPRIELLNILAEFISQYYLGFEDIDMVSGPFIKSILKNSDYFSGDKEPFKDVFKEIIENQELYGLDLDIYGDYKAKFNQT